MSRFPKAILESISTNTPRLTEKFSHYLNKASRRSCRYADRSWHCLSNTPISLLGPNNQNSLLCLRWPGSFLFLQRKFGFYKKSIQYLHFQAEVWIWKYKNKFLVSLLSVASLIKSLLITDRALDSAETYREVLYARNGNQLRTAHGEEKELCEKSHRSTRS